VDCLPWWGVVLDPEREKANVLLLSQNPHCNGRGSEWRWSCQPESGTYSTRVLTYSTRVLTYWTRVLTYWTRVLTYWTRVLTYSTRILTYSTRVLTYSTRVWQCGSWDGKGAVRVLSTEPWPCLLGSQLMVPLSTMSPSDPHKVKRSSLPRDHLGVEVPSMCAAASYLRASVLPFDEGCLSLALPTNKFG
jgi:hypothetical protein